MAVISINKHERLTVPAQTKLTPSESQELNELVEFFQEHGVPEATRSGVMRAAIVNAIAAHREQQEVESGKA